MFASVSGATSLAMPQRGIAKLQGSAQARPNSGRSLRQHCVASKSRAMYAKKTPFELAFGKGAKPATSYTPSTNQSQRGQPVTSYEGLSPTQITFLERKNGGSGSSAAAAPAAVSSAGIPAEYAGLSPTQIAFMQRKKAEQVGAGGASASGVEKQSFVTRPEVEDAIQAGIGNALIETNLNMGVKTQGKVRDFYDLGDLLVLITTDRQSAFDRNIATIPYKGQVLNGTSAWWFENSTHIVKNAVVATPDPNVVIMKKLEVIPVEIIIRGFMTGSTETSLWTHYKNGSRNYTGNILAEGMVKNQRLPKNICTPTTKGVVDVPIAGPDIVAQGLMSQAEWDGVSKAAMELFTFGQQEAAKRGLILVDTKYEFGRDGEGNFYLIDEVHTPDSSRYWVAESFEERHAAGLEPENIDKEFLRLWFRENCDPYKDETLPEAPAELVAELSRRYIRLYETITGEGFVPAGRPGEAPADRIQRTVTAALAQLRN